MEAQSKARSDKFYQEIALSIQWFDGCVGERVAAHQQSENFLRMKNLEYMMERLIERGVHKHMPSLITHINTIKQALQGN